MKKRMVIAVCATALLAGMVPATAFAADPAEHSFNLVLDAKDANGDGYVSAGEDVTLTVSLEGMDWATKANGLRMLGTTIYFNFNNKVLQITGDATAETGYSSIATNLAPGFSDAYVISDNAGTGSSADVNEDGFLSIVVELKSDNAPEMTVGADKTAWFTWHFKALEDLPAVEVNDLFSVTHTDFVFAPSLAAGHEAEVAINPTSRVDSSPKVDGVAPTVTLAGTPATDSATFYYYPVKLEVSESGSGLDKVTLDGKDITSATELTTGGKLVATDKCGNTTTVQVTIDATAYDAARKAADALSDTITYTDKAAIDAAQKALDAVTDETAKSLLADAQTKVTAAADAWDAIDAQVTAVEQSIAALPAVDELSLQDVQKLNEIEEAVTALQALNVTTADIENYATYTAATEKLAAVREEINAVKTLIDKLPDADKVGYGDEAEVEAAAEALTGLLAKYPNDTETINATVNADRLTAIQESLAGLLDAQKALVEKIASTEYAITLKDADVKVITDLRAEVKAMQDRDAAFTEEELQPLVNAENELKALQDRSAEAHKKVNALPGRDEILYTDRNSLTQLENEVKALQALGDTYAEDEQAKLDAAKAGIEDLNTAVVELADAMNALKDPTAVQYSDKDSLKPLDEQIEALAARACNAQDAIATLAVDDSSYAGTYDHYTAYAEAVTTMVESIDAANAEMDKALESWTYQDTDAFDAIRAKMDKLAETYGIADADKTDVFAEYATSTERDAAAKDRLDQAAAQIPELPEKVTLQNGAAVDAVTKLINELRKDYGFTDEMLKQYLGEDAFQAYTKAASTLAALRKPSQSTSQPTQTAKPATQTVTATADASANASATATVTIPQTADSLNLQAVLGMLALSLCGMGALILLRKKNR